MANKTVSLVEDLIADFLKENDLFLWDAEFVKEGRDWYLRLFIDRTDGEYVSTDDCEMVSEFLSKQLDERDPIEQNYYLEVSSPGMDRELVKPEHFKACIGKVRTVIDTKAQNRKPGARISPSALKECIIELPLKDIAKINLAVIFE